MAINRGSPNHTVTNFLIFRICDLNEVVIVVPC